LRWGPFLVGWACGIAAFAIRRRAIAALGKFWSLHVEIRENHEFVQSGPFRWVRPPADFSMILELLALTLICNAFFTLLLIPAFFVPVLIMRIRIEEVALVEKFGDAYRTFQRTKPALVPWKWSPSLSTQVRPRGASASAARNRSPGTRWVRLAPSKRRPARWRFTGRKCRRRSTCGTRKKAAISITSHKDRAPIQ